MATLCVASRSVSAPLSSSRSPAFQTASSTLKSAVLAVPSSQAQDVDLKVRASVQERCSRREAMTLAGGAGLTGLLLLLPVGSAEARNANPSVRRKIREELDKLKENAEKATGEVKKNVEEVGDKAKAAAEKVVKK